MTTTSPILTLAPIHHHPPPTPTTTATTCSRHNSPHDVPLTPCLGFCGECPLHGVGLGVGVGGVKMQMGRGRVCFRMFPGCLEVCFGDMSRSLQPLKPGLKCTRLFEETPSLPRRLTMPPVALYLRSPAQRRDSQEGRESLQGLYLQVLNQNQYGSFPHRPQNLVIPTLGTLKTVPFIFQIPILRGLLQRCSTCAPGWLQGEIQL